MVTNHDKIREAMDKIAEEHHATVDSFITAILKVYKDIDYSKIALEHKHGIDEEGHFYTRMRLVPWDS